MRHHAEHDEIPLCPSAQPEMAGSVVFGVVGGAVNAPRVGYLAEALPVTDELLALAGPAHPNQVFRIGAPCATSACMHFSANRCNLATRVAEELPVVADTLPACRLRPSCRWWQQEGVAACRRCPQVVTGRLYADDTYKYVAEPQPLPLLDERP